MRHRKQVLRASLAGALLLLSSGCHTVRYSTNLPGGGGRTEQNAAFFFWGLVGTKVVNLKTLCPQGAARWSNQQTFLDGLLGVITLGIYAPRTIVVECSNGVAFHLAPAGDASSYTVASVTDGGVR